MESRPLDYIYDPSNIVGCRADHTKALLKAQTYSVQVEPIFPNMFSKLPHYPSIQIRYRPSNKIDLNAAQANTASQQSVNNQNAIQTFVQGQHRFKYHRRALVPYIGALNGQVYYDNSKQRYARAAEPATPEPATKTIGIQTVYRESHAQTDPYTPEYLLPPTTPNGTQQYPEVLNLASLTYQNGLPVNIEEIEKIERAREKRRLKAELPEGTDEESFEKRLRMMEKMELQEWKDRENEISRIQKTRLNILIKLIEKRKQENEENNRQRLEKEWTRKLQERDILLTKLEKKKERELRRLDMKRRSIDYKPNKNDPIEKHVQQSLERKAGLFKKTNISDQIPKYHSENSLAEIEKAYKDDIEKVDVRLNISENMWKEPKIRQELQYQKTLDYIWSTVINKESKEVDDQPLKFKSKVVKQEVRAATPIIPVPTPQAMFEDRCTLFIQKLTRGKAVHKQMKEGLERNADLVEELRTQFNQVQEQEEQKEFNEFRVLIGPEDQMDKNIESTLTAAYLGKMFDFYTKELVRLREERRLSAMVLLAERTRKAREAEEIERRKEEIAIREFEERAYREAMDIHSITVESYLEGIIEDSIETTGDLVALESVQEYAEKLKKYENREDSKVVSDLVLSFLIPEVWRQTLLEDVNKEQQKYLKAAQDCIAEAVLPNDQILTNSLGNLSLAADKPLRKSNSSLAASREFEPIQ